MRQESQQTQTLISYRIKHDISNDTRSHRQGDLLTKLEFAVEVDVELQRLYQSISCSAPATAMERFEISQSESARSRLGWTAVWDSIFVRRSPRLRSQTRRPRVYPGILESSKETDSSRACRVLIRVDRVEADRVEADEADQVVGGEDGR
ncbi:hypothetical protein THAOC_20131, partial [Thalassiosira oceanica]